VVLALISVSGLLCLTGVSSFQVREGYEVPDNFSSWKNFWAGSGTGANAFVNGLYNVIWSVYSWISLLQCYSAADDEHCIRSFIGYSNANYALSEVRDPVRTIKRAAPLAMFAVSAVYLFINVAYFSVVSKTDILESKRIVAYVDNLHFNS
jgi:amino acid transporter